MTVLVVLLGLLLAFANGANDNFKGVATVHGSGTAGYRRALIWATSTTALGSLAAFAFARELLGAFTGKGLVPAQVVSAPVFPAAVALAAGVTVLLATRWGFPVSTTHALIGALVGAGLLVSGEGVDPSKLAHSFMLPLLISPFIAVAGAAALYPPLRFLRLRWGVTQETCICVGESAVAAIESPAHAPRVLRSAAVPTILTGTPSSCPAHGGDRAPGIGARTILDVLHWISAGAVSFARGLNDTPKIAALLLVGGVVGPGPALVSVGAMIATGGILGARRVARTMSHRVTGMNPGQGFSANLVTAVLVIAASRFGLPVSTTHVSCGSLFGIGAVTGRARWDTIGKILLAWIITLPVAAALGAIFAALLTHVSR